MADGEDVYLVIDSFAYDSVRFAKDLTKTVSVWGNGVKTFSGYNWAEVWKTC